MQVDGEWLYRIEYETELLFYYSTSVYPGSIILFNSCDSTYVIPADICNLSHCYYAFHVTTLCEDPCTTSYPTEVYTNINAECILFPLLRFHTMLLYEL